MIISFEKKKNRILFALVGLYLPSRIQRILKEQLSNIYWLKKTFPNWAFCLVHV